MPSGEDNPDRLSDDFEILRGERTTIVTKAVTDTPNMRVVYCNKVVEVQDREDVVEVAFRSGFA
jgi:hypothetical protein